MEWRSSSYRSPPDHSPEYLSATSILSNRREEAMDIDVSPEQRPFREFTDADPLGRISSLSIRGEAMLCTKEKRGYSGKADFINRGSSHGDCGSRQLYARSQSCMASFGYSSHSLFGQSLPAHTKAESRSAAQASLTVWSKLLQEELSEDDSKASALSADTSGLLNVTSEITSKESSSRDSLLKTQPAGTRLQAETKTFTAAVARMEKKWQAICLGVCVLCVGIVFSFLNADLTHSQCSDIPDISTLHRQLQQKVFGQHVAVQVVTESLQSFFDNSSSHQHHNKLLVMSFHGWTGVGKNYLASIVAQSFSPKSVHKLIIPLHFPHGTLEEAENLHNWIVSNSSATADCKVHLYIIDEVDKASETMIHKLRDTFTELNLSLTDVASIFLLLSNDGALEINKFMLDMATEGRAREDVKYGEIRIVPEHSWYEEFEAVGLLHYMVPFLPLELQHTTQCIEAALESRNVTASNQLVKTVLTRLQFFPPDRPIFSKTGCRKVGVLVDLVS